MNTQKKKNNRQAQRRAAGDRSELKYSKKYVFIIKNMTFGPLGHVLTLLNGPPDSYFLIFFFSNIRFLSFIVTLSPLAKNAVPMVKSVNFDSLGPLLPFLKAHPPKVMKNGNFQK